MKSVGKRLGHWAMITAALLALTLPRLITAAPLDLVADSDAQEPAEESAENFPGSAFFFAEGMFDNRPARQVGSGHVLTLAAVQAAPVTSFRGLTPLDSYRALNCLTSAIYYEAGNEPEEGQRAVAQVVLNRVRNPLWPHSICGVVYEGSERSDLRCQFSFSCDGSMARAAYLQGWTRARRVAEQALSGRVFAPVGLATFYHTLAVRPTWAGRMDPVAVVGAHIFYRSPGAHGAPAAFRVAYAGRELQSGPTPRPARPVAVPRPLAPFAWGEEGSATPFETSPTTAVSTLPQSTIRPEFQNSGRPRI